MNFPARRLSALLPRFMAHRRGIVRRPLSTLQCGSPGRGCFKDSASLRRAWTGGARWVGTITKDDSERSPGIALARCVSLHGASGAGHTLLDSALLARDEYEDSATSAFKRDTSAIHTAIASGPPRRHHSPFPHRYPQHQPHVPTGCIRRPSVWIWISDRFPEPIPKTNRGG